MQSTPKGNRLHIGIFGRRNVGKSSLLNALTRQNVSIVSDVAGTTTDPVEKPMELLPIGPVLFIDTAGVDDVGTLGEMRVARTRAIFDRADVGILVVGATNAPASDAVANLRPAANEGSPRSRAWERDLDKANSEFNAALRRYANGEMTRGDALYFGVPGETLRSTGLPDAPILMHQRVLRDHLMRHAAVRPDDLLDLVRKANQPIAVFKSHMVPGARVILVNHAIGENHLSLAIHIKQSGQHSEIASIHDKSSGWFENATQKGELLLVDKTKGDWLLKLNERSTRSGSSIQSPSHNIIVYSSAEVKSYSENMLPDKQATAWGEFEQAILDELHTRNVPTIVVFNKADIAPPPADLLARLAEQKIAAVATIASRGEGVLDLREALIRSAPEDFINAPAIVGDLVGPGELAVLVVPIDLEAPKGRLILPQVQSIRDLLDADAYCMVVKERELRDALDRLNRPPALVVTDSQGFLKVAGDTPPNVPLTSFSILFARYRGDLCEFVRGAMAIDQLRPGDRVLIAEACSHHPMGEDIGRVKIPRWLTQYVGGKLEFTTVQGHDFPDDVSPYKLIVHCGACMWNRREMLSRMLRCRKAGVPIANYGMTIAYTLGIFERALGPFPAALETYRQLRAAGQ